MNARAARLLRAPLHFHVATLFVFLILLVGALLAFNQYRNTTHILLDSSDQLTDVMARFIQAEIQHRQNVAIASINSARLANIVSATDWNTRQQNLPWLQQQLRNHELISGFIFGYPDGDSIVAHPTLTRQQKLRYNAPENAELAVDHIDREGDTLRDARRYYFDAMLQLVDVRPLAEAAYDPRTRPWYRQALDSPDIVITEPYLFYISRTVGITFARQAQNGVVVSVDFPLDTLSELLKTLQLPPRSDAVIFDRHAQVIAYLDHRQMAPYTVNSEIRARRLSELDSPLLQAKAEWLRGQIGRQNFDFGGERWISEVLDVGVVESMPFKLAILIPEAQLLAQAYVLRRQNMIVGVIILIASIPVAWLLSRLVSTPLRQLERDTAAIRAFRFDEVETAPSIVLEIHRLGHSINLMSETIAHFLQMIGSLAEEKQLDALLNKVADETRATMGAEAAVMLLFSEDRQALEPRSVSAGEGAHSINPEQLPRLPVTDPWLQQVLIKQDIEQRAWEPDSALCQTLQRILNEAGNHGAQVVMVPLLNRDHKLVGLLSLLFRTHGDAKSENALIHARLPFIREISNFAAVSVETRQLILHQKRLFAAFVELIAGAIDAKSPYTGGHCQRVPVLTEMLAQAACAATDPPFANFALNDEEWEALHMAGWLHDCGKVTTPEHVVDKATKLECRYDRIHEIRMRFELLKREAECDYWKQQAPVQHDTDAWNRLLQHWQQLDDDYAFIAQCNLGAEFMPEATIQRLWQIGQRQWTRTLSDRIGISWEEAQRKQAMPEPSLPTREFVLSDRPDHLISRAHSDLAARMHEQGFNLQPPEYQYNLGELHNLGITRGTLTEEERFLINDHIVQTIIMLECLPYPDHLKSVPALAGGHHEKMDGKGYPRGLKGRDMPLAARMMAIADIFEALTAADRPYKMPKTLSESLRIMSVMVKHQHIDPDLFQLFVRSGVYRQYAERYLRPEQLDSVDETALLAVATSFNEIGG